MTAEAGLSAVDRKVSYPVMPFPPPPVSYKHAYACARRTRRKHGILTPLQDAEPPLHPPFACSACSTPSTSYSAREQ